MQPSERRSADLARLVGSPMRKLAVWWAKRLRLGLGARRLMVCLRSRNVKVDAFLAALDSARHLVAAPEVEAGWERPSALADLTIGALTAHLVSAVAGIDSFLDRPVPDDVDIADLNSYYSDEAVPASLRDALNAFVTDAAKAGPVAVLAHFDEVRDRLRARLPVEPSDRPMRIPSRDSPRGEGSGGRYMRLDDFLVTRVVEVVVHSDDLAASASLPSPTFPAQVGDAVIGLFVEVCRRRHGDSAVVRAFTRRERDAAHALRVF
jgi:hypothetical protein